MKAIEDFQKKELNLLELRKYLIGKRFAPECCQNSFADGIDRGKEYLKFNLLRLLNENGLKENNLETKVLKIINEILEM